MYFTITTNKEVAECIKKQFEFDEKFHSDSSIELGKITHEAGYSIVEIKSKSGIHINPEDIFWVGHHSARFEHCKNPMP